MTSRHLLFQSGHATKALQTSSGTIGGFYCIHGSLKVVCAIPKERARFPGNSKAVFDIMKLSHQFTKIEAYDLSNEGYRSLCGDQKIAALKERYQLVTFTFHAGDIL
jgi:hypothetical protein